MVSALLSRLVILLFGTLYPAYASYKAVKTKNVKEYVKWMMYWIVFAFFTCVETFADIFIAWLPFYYELKIVFVLWLLSPATKGSSILYRKIIHPQLSKREKDIDGYIAKASDRGYSTLLSLGSQGFTYATNVVLNTAIKGQSKIAEHVRKSYSLNDLSTETVDGRRPIEDDIALSEDEDNRQIEESYQREMMEKDVYKEKKSRQRRTTSGSDEEIEPSSKGRKSSSYSHKELSEEKNVKVSKAKPVAGMKVSINQITTIIETTKATTTPSTTKPLHNATHQAIAPLSTSRTSQGPSPKSKTSMSRPLTNSSPARKPNPAACKDMMKS